MNAKNKQPTFPYVPYPAFKTFISYLHDTALPEQIDHTMMPSNFSGGTRAAVMSALKSLGLIDAQSNTTQKLKDLVTAFNSNEWPTKVKECVVSAYDGVAQGINLKSASRKQAEQMFEGTTAQMKNKCIRFFLTANKEAGIEYSPHLKIRRKSTTPRKSTRRTTAKTPTFDRSTKKPPDKVQESNIKPKGSFDQPIPIMSEFPCFIRIPLGITVGQVELVKAAVNFIEAMAKQNEESK